MKSRLLAIVKFDIFFAGKRQFFELIMEGKNAVKKQITQY